MHARIRNAFRKGHGKVADVQCRDEEGPSLMDRTNRLALLGAGALLLAVTGSVLATRAPSGPAEPALLAASHQAEAENETDTEEADGDGLARAQERLAERGLDTSRLAELAERYGVGGAVRLIAWSDQTGTGIDDLVTMRNTGGVDGEPMGWGRMARELGLHPGLGGIMGNGNGHGNGNAGGPPGHARRPDKAGGD